MLVASIQMAGVEDDKERTIEKAVENVQRARGADLIVLPELWNIGFMSFDRYLSEAEDKNGPTLTTMKGLARDVKAYLHAGSFVEKDDGKYYNSSYLISPEGEILANYRKLHLYGYDSKESQVLSRGDSVVVAKTPLATFGLATCYDLRFPELFRRMLEKGTEVFLVCSAWPYPRLEAWIMLNRVRALENLCFLVSANYVGLNRGIQLAGHSMMVDPWGVILTSGGDEEVILQAELDPEVMHSARERYPALADRLDWLGNVI